ncbi:hypothetical protein EXIGLDRAFT_758203 [Exidia glandulosa HHB12029]|uniref:Manganese/iron superoxide dismutase C-terminal domain-containing protein n=1 Tax=Exidia glandulosa HHB12029 TaxID=1314781 RepID=A0A165QPF7_EXIGL|nr:hypothetical protein EXIGLDRAFT_758203 [Exidia glandulosa HHB12029]
MRLASSTALLHALTRSAAAARPRVRRSLHSLRPLPYDLEKGLGAFLPPQALHVIAIDYQSGLLERLNNLIKGAFTTILHAVSCVAHRPSRAGTRYEYLSLVQTVIASARDAKDIDIFNTASQALNNDFFLENLRDPSVGPSDEQMILSSDHDFSSAVQRSFGNLDNLKSVVSATAMGMQSSGWVWLVQDTRGDLAALPTFGSGTILVKDRIQNNGIMVYARKNVPASAIPLDALDEEELAVLTELEQGLLQEGSSAASEDDDDDEYEEDEDEEYDESEEDEEEEEEEDEDESEFEDEDLSKPAPSPPTSQLSSPTSGSLHVPRGGPPPGTRSFHVSAFLRAASDYNVAGSFNVNQTTGFAGTTGRPIGNTQPGSRHPNWDAPGQAHADSQRMDRPAEDLLPLFCISVHEHAWMAAGYGVWGKEEYLRRFWGALDWSRVLRDWRVTYKLASNVPPQ